jgi:hypothetical protein|tara:strand:- start:632 stop:1222 length:591 start_codon:yes stop_codon:yes gene_type:complete
MIDLPDTTYNEEKDGIIPIVAGVYPAHISGLDSRDLTTKAGEQKVFNITFLIPKEVENTQVSKMIKNGHGELTQATDENGQPMTIPASFMTGKRFNSVGIWLTPNPDEGQGWKNRKYKEFFENVGVTFPTNKKGDTLLAEVEGEDIIGHPCFIKLGQERYTKDGEERSVWKAFEVFPWTAGEKLSQDEVDSDDLPF